MTAQAGDTVSEPVDLVRRSPTKCRHEEAKIKEKDKVEDGKGNVIGYHVRCRKCGVILRTTKGKPR